MNAAALIQNANQSSTALRWNMKVLKKALKNYFTAKTPRAQRTCSKDKTHLFGEDVNHPHFYLNSCSPLASSRLCGGSSIPTAIYRLVLGLVGVWLAVSSATVCASDSDPRQVRVGNLIYADDKTSVCFSDRFLTTVQTEAGINTEKRMHAVRLGRADELLAVPFVIMNGQQEFTLPAGERALLKRYLHGGGFLLASAGCSAEQWTASFRRELEAVFGVGCLKPVPTDHPLFSTLFTVTDISLTHGGNAQFEGLFIDGRLACLFSKEGLNDTEHTQGCCCCGGNEVRKAEEIVANALVYALVE